MGASFIVVGGNNLTYRLVYELTEHYDVRAAAIVPAEEKTAGPAGSAGACNGCSRWPSRSAASC
jgi:hypothetical protein